MGEHVYGRSDLHVLMIPSWYPAHSTDVDGVFFRDQALALLAAGNCVGVIAVKRRALSTLMHASMRVLEFEEDEGVPTYRRTIWSWLPGLPYGNYALVHQATIGIFQRYLEEQGRPDVIHAHSAIYGGAVAEYLGRRHDIPVVLTEHSTRFARNDFRPWQLRLAAKAFEGAAARIAVSPALGKSLEERFPVAGKSWTWIPNVVAPRFEKGASARRPNRSRVRLLNLALMTAKKGQHDLLEAYARAFARDSRVELWLGGDGPLRPVLERRTSELGLAGHVRFLGRVPPGEVPGLLSEIDVMVISSHYETFGVVAAESLMVGRPVVATRCGGPECIVEPEDGILVNPRDPASLGQALVDIVENLDRYPPMDLADRARQRFGGGAVAAQLSEVYKSVLRERRIGAVQVS